jgi:GNAT superfamily N-acetyltransferase
MSGGQQPHVVAAGPADLMALRQLIADAFAGLAPSRWLIADPAERRRVFPGYFQLYLEQALACGLVHCTADRTAVALWLPGGPGAPGLPPGHGAALAAATSPFTGRFACFDATLDARHPAGTAHSHLAILAVRPDRQRHGLGTVLLRDRHQVLDREGMPAYLEASDWGTRALYLRHGYDDLGPPIQLPGGPMMYPMWREPRPGSARYAMQVGVSARHSKNIERQAPRAGRSGSAACSATALAVQPFLQPDGHALAFLLADRLAHAGLHRQLVRAVAHGHERAAERRAVYRAADLYQAAGTEELRGVRHDHVGPAALGRASLQGRGELPLEDHRAALLISALSRLDRRSARNSSQRASDGGAGRL